MGWCKTNSLHRSDFEQKATKKTKAFFSGLFVPLRFLLLISKFLLQFCQRLRTVAQSILNLCAQFGKGLLESIRDEQRIVAEPTPAARRKINPPLTNALEELGLHLQLVGEADRRGRW